MDELIKAIVAILGTALGTAAVWAVTQLARKFGVELSAEQRERVNAFAREAIAGIEEKAAAAIKSQAAKITPADKLNAAVSVLLDKVPGITRDEAADIIHAQLPIVRGAAVGFSTALLKQATNSTRRRRN